MTRHEVERRSKQGVMLKTAGVPEPGRLVRLRQRRWLVEEVATPTHLIPMLFFQKVMNNLRTSSLLLLPDTFEAAFKREQTEKAGHES